MATKWKSRALLLAWILLVTFGLSGILSALSQGSDYFKKDYFQTQGFAGQLNEFIDYLSIFELNYRTPEEMKKGITVSQEEIEEHRNRYGDLATQIADITGQYEEKILAAENVKNKELADIYITERDTKIEDIANNFKSDDHVRAKIVKEKEEKIDQYYRKLEDHRTQFANVRTGFIYYLKDNTTGEVFTNLAAANESEANQLMNSKNTLFIRSYPNAQYGYLRTTGRPYNFGYNEELLGNPLVREKAFEGKIAVPMVREKALEGGITVPNAAATTSMILSNYHDYQQKQQLFLIYTLSALLSLLLSFYIYKKTTMVKLAAIENWQAYYNRIPLDVSVGIFVFIGFITLIRLTYPYALYLHEYFYSFVVRSLVDVIVTAPFLALTLSQGKLILARVNDRTKLQAEWTNSLTHRVCCGIKGAFLIRSIGTQIIIILLLVFACGVGSIVVLMEPEMLLLYLPFLIVIGIPMAMLIFKRMGYFNRIVCYTNELTRGNLEPDLPVLGKSVLATLAHNINQLKQGVKSSQREQAKSERLKTELITNVSHDLRTPLTSIITYTELLKTPDLAEEDREAYIQIIDRKAKRLKVLIDDLFEASKMASGSIELTKEKVDLVQLLQQALAEHNEAISESTLQLRVTTPDKPLHALVDGQKLWRVFDNLIGNILKYSLENTRVYISMKNSNNKAVLIFKNVTKYELGENIDEMFERFKRGDTSRHTDGSGLGLAIAKSIVDLHQGNLDIEVDGDLFKITLTLNTL
ncbi:sensor histidine kinase [Desulfotomaculum sp. 1211_IL3151]|uniref:sensor histidine kinase n=1 Tax=Desulfotomaculum sp. 1211_IL3151 TaxID=3084055 RepID=UPI002FD8D444